MFFSKLCWVRFWMKFVVGRSVCAEILVILFLMLVWLF